MASVAFQGFFEALRFKPAAGPGYLRSGSVGYPLLFPIRSCPLLTKIGAPYKGKKSEFFQCAPPASVEAVVNRGKGTFPLGIPRGTFVNFSKS
jgi:hypothetical protein